ncbi:TAXI family TRAP transporter solute-binding subunit [Natranaerofaba carboxydovora]|uniref:TAXI family TRAP transporter solute-binding subunit n=1 Tax=Natranaerofaba carboxydovora TaxID=2742683 RepID=UPI001F138C29|nr:TAXI family TRAP transporter solute-binding subunit [Natranaerofaba carboxydovora]UMZ73703.1 NMT1-like family protein [Natranaerofaba carboxydovora]UMZ73710.1 NMT1-like family protein [Natranaerofaba carboxydovora]
MEKFKKFKMLALLMSIVLIGSVVALVGCGGNGDVDEDGDGASPTEFRWGTSDTGSTGHAALTALTTILNREMDGYNYTVLPTPGAVYSMSQYAEGEMDGFYGADVAFLEYGEERDRFEDFDYEGAERELVQTFWGYTLEVGLAVHGNDYDDYDEWRDLEGEVLFTGPAAWDVRAALRIPLQDALEMDYEYNEIDLDMVASSLDAGHIAGINAYTSSESTVPGWLLEAELATDIQVLNPSDEEIEILNEAGYEIVEIDADVFESDMDVDTVKRIPFFYGFHMGPEVAAEDVYEMLNVIHEYSDELAQQDESFAQINEDMVEIQVRGIESSVDHVDIHPGLQMFLEDHDAWNSDWDDSVAE